MASLRASPLMMLLGTVFFFAANVFAAAAVLGVDIGTEYIKAALVKPGIPLEIVLTKDSRRKETSAVAFKPIRGEQQAGQFPEREYGADAMALAARFPGDVYPNIKTLLGLPVDNPIVQEYAARHPALQLEAHSSRNTAAFKSKTFKPDEEAWMVEELLAMELQSIQKNAEATAGDGSSVRSVVLTVPAFYTIEEKRAVQAAAELAGLKVLSLISDGLAVGLNYATSRQFPNINDGAKPEYHMVFDMGAGSTVATVMKFQSRTVKDIGKFNKTVQEVQVLGSGWDRTLGGDALNYLIMDDMVDRFVESKGAQKISATAEGVKAHGRAMAKISKEAERLRHVLSANQNTQASMEGLYEDVDFKYKITRAGFETMVEAHAERVSVAVNDAVKMAGLDIGDLTSIVLHGGTTRTPFVQKALEKLVGSGDKLRSNVNSDEAAVFGAGFRAADLSPSFRVKEIRISEGSMYQAGVKWTGSNGKAQRQRLWTAISPMGAHPKEMTFSEDGEVSTTFYQQVGEEDKDIGYFSTKNLTATVAAIKEKYPSCIDSDVEFKVAFSFSGENGEVQVPRAVVECEAEVTEKEGFVDGVKNLFGFGKKDQQPLTGEEGEEAKIAEDSEGVKSEKDAEPSASAAADAASSSDAGSASEAAPAEASEEPKSVTKKQLVNIPVDYVLEKRGVPELSSAALTKTKDRLKAFAASDKARKQREEALNQLEGFTYKVRDILENEEFIARSTEAERTKLAEKSSEISEWLYEDGADASKDELKKKLKELQDLASPAQKRVDEAEKRPALVKEVKEALDRMGEMLDTLRKQITDYEAWQSSSSASAAEATQTDSASDSPAGEFDGLEDDATPAADEKPAEETPKGPAPPIYKAEDIAEVETFRQGAITWLDEMVAKQDALGLTDDAILLSKDLKAKSEEIEKAGMDLALKGVKYYKKESKKSGKKSSDKKKAKGKSKTKSADDASQTLKINPEDGPLTDEQLEEMLEAIMEQQKQKGGDDNDKKSEEPIHDEL